MWREPGLRQTILWLRSFHKLVKFAHKQESHDMSIFDLRTQDQSATNSIEIQQTTHTLVSKEMYN